MSYPCQCTQPCIDVEHIERQITFSRNTFGPGERRAGVIDHIRKELVEIEDDGVLSEWVDVIILALDGAWRSGATPHQIIAAVKAKQVKNEARDWPGYLTDLDAMPDPTPIIEWAASVGLDAKDIPADGVRISELVDATGDVAGVPVEYVEYGEPTGLPDRRPDVDLIVSRVLAFALPHRKDLCFPSREVRDDTGRIIGCRALGYVDPRGTAR